MCPWLALWDHRQSLGTPSGQSCGKTAASASTPWGEKESENSFIFPSEPASWILSGAGPSLAHLV